MSLKNILYIIFVKFKLHGTRAKKLHSYNAKHGYYKLNLCTERKQ